MWHSQFSFLNVATSIYYLRFVYGLEISYHYYSLIISFSRLESDLKLLDGYAVVNGHHLDDYL